MAIGIGFDAHRLVPGRKLILGGIPLPYDRGLLGYSDGDALVHALMDALLGAAGLGDIGSHFPDTDPQYKDADSIRLLVLVKEMIAEQGYRLVNADVTLLAQRPKMNPYFSQMRKRIAGVVGVDEDAIGLKATTTEGLGFVGREEGIAALCVVQLEKRP